MVNEHQLFPDQINHQNTYQSAFGKQATGIYATISDFKEITHVLCYPQLNWQNDKIFTIIIYLRN